MVDLKGNLKWIQFQHNLPAHPHIVVAIMITSFPKARVIVNIKATAMQIFSPRALQ